VKERKINASAADYLLSGAASGKTEIKAGERKQGERRKERKIKTAQPKAGKMTRVAGPMFANGKEKMSKKLREKKGGTRVVKRRSAGIDPYCS